MDHIIMEANLHEAFGEIRNNLRAMILVANDKIFPEDIIKKFVDSVAEAMGDAQESLCKTCSVPEGCPTKDKFANHLRSGGYDTLKLEMEQVFGKKEEKAVPPDFSRKFLEN